MKKVTESKHPRQLKRQSGKKEKGMQHEDFLEGHSS